MEQYLLYSGDCCIGAAGAETELTDSYDEKLFIGDIVVIWTEISAPSLTVVCDDIQNTQAETHGKIGGPFIMGIRSVDYKSEGSDWNVVKVKDHRNLVDGEHWPSFGFSVHRVNSQEQS